MAETDCISLRACRREMVFPRFGRKELSFSLLTRFQKMHSAILQLQRLTECSRRNVLLFPFFEGMFGRYAQGTNRIMGMEKATFDTLLLQDCFYCGKKNNPPLHFNGVDRIDSTNRSYELSNVVSCCKTCNSLKWSFAREVFLQHVRRVALFFDLNLPPLPRIPGDRHNPIVL
jgi:hypothetical protein